MNIIFLDIDGVLNCEYTTERHNGCTGIDKFLLHRFLKIQKKTSAKVVLSSTWRIGRVYPLMALALNLPIIDRTRDGEHLSMRSEPRGYQIKDYLDKHPEVTQYVIVDDDSDMLLWQQHYFFKTDNYSGLTPTTTYLIKRFFTHKTF